MGMATELFEAWHLPMQVLPFCFFLFVDPILLLWITSFYLVFPIQENIWIHLYIYLYICI